MFFFGRLHSLQKGNGLIWHARVIIITKIAAMNFDLTLKHSLSNRSDQNFRFRINFNRNRCKIFILDLGVKLFFKQV